MKKYFIIIGIVFVFICGIFAGVANQSVTTAAVNDPEEKKIVLAYIDRYRPELVYDEVVVDESDVWDTDHGVLTQYSAYHEGKLVGGGWVNVAYYDYLLN